MTKGAGRKKNKKIKENSMGRSNEIKHTNKKSNRREGEEETNNHSHDWRKRGVRKMGSLEAGLMYVLFTYD